MASLHRAMAIGPHIWYSVALYTARLYYTVRAVPIRKVFMVRLRVHELMTARGITAYKLCQGTDLTYPSAYRLSRAGGRFGRLHAETLDELCRYFKVQPGKLLQWMPAKGS
jgi:DNA-binding Xre family transcriptional regulator